MEQGSTLQPMEETTVEQVDLHRRRLPPVEDPCWSRFRAGPVARGEEPTQEQESGGSCRPPVGDPCWSSLLLGDGWMDPVGRSRVGAVLEELLPVGSPHKLSWGRAASMGGTPQGVGAGRDREGAAEMKCHRLEPPLSCAA